MKPIQSITEQDILPPHSKWNGNDASGSWHTGLLNPSITRDFTLTWKRSKSSPPHFVGHFRFHLNKLVASGHCYRHGDKVRISLFHDADGGLRVRRSRAGTDGIEIAGLPW